MTTTNTITLEVPRIHLNGTSAESLLEDIDTAFDAIGVAFDALKRTAPNGRDFYFAPHEALQVATEEHRSRLLRLQNVQGELEAIATAIHNREPEATFEPAT